MKEELLDFFNKKDFSIYSLYKIAPRHIFELIENYKTYAPSQYKKLIDDKSRLPLHLERYHQQC